MDKSKVEEEINENVVASKNWNDRQHVAKFICQGLIREVIVQPRRRGMFLNSFQPKKNYALVLSIWFWFRFFFQAFDRRSSSKKLELHLWSRKKGMSLNNSQLKTKVMQSVKYMDLQKLLDLLWNFWKIFQELIIGNLNFFLHNIYFVFWFI
jgi:hypothetical protein